LNWSSVEFLSDSTHPISYQMLTVWSQCRCFRWHMSHGTSTFSMIRPCIPIMEWLSIADSKYKKCLNSNALSYGSITWHDRGHCNSKIHYISRQPLIPFFFQITIYHCQKHDGAKSHLYVLIRFQTHHKAGASPCTLVRSNANNIIELQKSCKCVATVYHWALGSNCYNSGFQVVGHVAFSSGPQSLV